MLELSSIHELRHRRFARENAEAANEKCHSLNWPVMTTGHCLIITRMKKLLEALIDRLPLHAEEGNLRESIPEEELVAGLATNGRSPETTRMLVQLLRTQLCALCLLDTMELARNHWAFVSFPASLLGRSLLETFATSSALLPTDYWEQGEHRPDNVKEEQRRWLNRIETARLDNNHDARPVRVVHVAWAIIRIGNQFLLSHREDRNRPGEKSHVLPGGRLNMHDLANSDRSPGILRQLFDPQSTLADESIDKTLKRELSEELDGLRHGEHYQCARWARLPPYRMVAGAGNRHAYTEYAFTLYTLQLTPAGELHLLDCEASQDKLSWFTADEIAAGKKADGTTAFVDVLHKSWGEQIAETLASIPDACVSGYSLADETRMIDLPASNAHPLRIGKTGKERNIELGLTEPECHLIQLLGWHALGFAIEAKPGIQCLGGGWVRFNGEAITVARSILAKGLPHDLPLLDIREQHMRLNINPKFLCVGAEAFHYLIEEEDSASGTLTLIRQAIDTPWARLPELRRQQRVKANTLKILWALDEGKDPESFSDKAGDWSRNLGQQLKPLIEQIGLRKLWRTENKVDTAFVVRRLGSA